MNKEINFFVEPDTKHKDWNMVIDWFQSKLKDVNSTWVSDFSSDGYNRFGFVGGDFYIRKTWKQVYGKRKYSIKKYSVEDFISTINYE